MRLATVLRNLLFGKRAAEYRAIVHDNINARHIDSGTSWRHHKQTSEVLRSAQGAIDLIEQSRRDKPPNKTSKIP